MLDYNISEDDGVFWMAWTDFCRLFAEITVCRLLPNHLEARQVGGHLRQFDQQARDPGDRFPGIVAVLANQSACPRTVDELFRQPHVERRQRRLAIRHDIDLVAPGAEDDDRAELRISRDAGTQLQRARGFECPGFPGTAP